MLKLSDMEKRPSMMQALLQRLRLWALLRLAGKSSVMINVDYDGFVRLRGSYPVKAGGEWLPLGTLTPSGVLP